MKDQTRKISKFLSLVLRHQPEAAGLELDENGWVSVETLIAGVSKFKSPIDWEMLEHVVESNDKQRFTFNEDKSMIRANQGHSVEIDLQLEPIAPPVTLFHGTATRFTEGIFKDGLVKMSRQHLHLSADIETAGKVGIRHGKLVILLIDAARMHEDGHLFYQSKNGVWLTERVPAEYISKYTSEENE